MDSRWSDATHAGASRPMPGRGSARIWRCAPTRRGCSGRSEAGAARRRQHLGQDPGRPTCSATKSPVLCVKGSGWDLADDRAAGPSGGAARPAAPAARAARAVRRGMVNALRSNLLDAARPIPSVETLLHAFLPHKFVDHTHSDRGDRALPTSRTPSGLPPRFGGRVACVPYAMPGFRAGQARRRGLRGQP